MTLTNNALNLLKAGILSFVLISGTAQAMLPQQERFNQWLDVLEKPLASGTNLSETSAKLLAAPLSRIAAFNLQGLGKIYSDQDKKQGRFDKMAEQLKELEDAIGAVDKWTNVGNAKEKAVAMKALQQLLKTGKWTKNGKSPRIQEIRDFVTNFDWSDTQEDQEYFAGHLLGSLHALKKTKFTFGNLETGNGLHEFRRSLRWILMKARVLNGGIQFNPEMACTPGNFYETLLTKPIANSKYSKLETDPSGEYTCKISQCLFLSIVDVVEEIGVIKDKIEKLHNNSKSDKVPEEFKKQAEEIYESFVEHDSVGDLIEEMKTCTKDKD